MNNALLLSTNIKTNGENCMQDNTAVIDCEYVTFKHIKTRKCVVLEMEVPEERFQEVINKLGMPIGGESKPVAVCLLDKSIIEKTDPIVIERTVGEKLRIRAIMLCKDPLFWKYCSINIIPCLDEEKATNLLYNKCEIKSRSELAIDEAAQEKFKCLLNRFNQWKIEEQYKDNFIKEELA